MRNGTARTAVVLAMLALSTASYAAQGAAKPNIVIILADDMGRAEYSGFGTKDVRTPNIDRIAERGMTFENFYANSCVCSPTRAALLTGCYPDRVGVPGVIRQGAANCWGYLDPLAATLPQVVKRAGYDTSLIGKWHLGLTPPNLPNDRGFDHFHGFLGDMMDDYRSHRRGGENFMRQDRETIDPQGHATDLFSDWASQTITDRARAKQPFFLLLTYNAPHDPLQPPVDWFDRVRQRQPGITPTRAKLVALIEHMDAGIGRVLAALDKAGVVDNTLVVFTSDNGGLLNSEANNGPYRSGKTHVYEGGLRVPFLACWPGRIKAGSRTLRIALTMDLFATALEAAGATPPPGIDGLSFLPTLLGTEQPEPNRDLYFMYREGGPRLGRQVEALRQGRWKLVLDNPFGPAELFDIAADPFETTNVIAKEPRIFQEMAALLRDHLQKAGMTPWQPPRSGN